MPVSDATEANKKTFDKQVAPGIRQVAEGDAVAKVEGEMAQNAERASLFFKAGIFAFANPPLTKIWPAPYAA